MKVWEAVEGFGGGAFRNLWVEGYESVEALGMSAWRILRLCRLVEVGGCAEVSGLGLRPTGPPTLKRKACSVLKLSCLKLCLTTNQFLLFSDAQTTIKHEWPESPLTLNGPNHQTIELQVQRRKTKRDFC